MLSCFEFGHRYLARHKVPEAKTHAELLLAHVLGVKRKEIYLNRRASCVVRRALRQYFRLLKERAVKKKPLAYIIGSQDFMGLSFKVVEHTTLIPRPETESLVELVLKKIKKTFQKNSFLRVLDVGAGTGCIGLSLWYFLKSDYKVSCVLTDSSRKALNVAHFNIQRLAGKGSGLSIYHSEIGIFGFDRLKDLTPQSFHVIVSNPPYVKNKEFRKLPPEIRLWEPREALVSGPDGLDVIRNIIKGARQWLNPNGFLTLEIDSRQTSQVKDLLIRNSYKDIEISKDLEGRDRVIYGRL